MDAAPFDSPAVRWHRHLAPIIRSLLGPACYLAHAGALMSLPGSQDQGAHPDGRQLFEEDGELDDTGGGGGDEGQKQRRRQRPHLPVHCISVFIPLVDLDTNGENGPTQFWPGTHAEAARGGNCRAAPEWGGRSECFNGLKRGSAIMFDYRIVHRGLGNRSRVRRPLLYLTYARSWFRDATNYSSASIWGGDEDGDDDDDDISAQSPLIATLPNFNNSQKPPTFRCFH